MEETVKVAINFSKNDDIDWIAGIFVGSVLGEGDEYWTHCESKIQSNQFLIKRKYGAYSASSVKQLANIGRAIWGARQLLRAKTVYILNPSLVNIVVILLVMLRRKDPIRLVSVVHDVLPHYGGVRGLLYKIQNRLIFNRSRQICVFSEFSRAQLLNQIDAKVECVLLPLPSPAERSVRVGVGGDSISLGNKEFDFVWWGRPEKYKGIDLLPEMADRLKLYGKSLLVVSRLDKAEKYYSELARRSNVTLVCQFLDEPELIRQLLRARFNLCPYLTATQSGVVSFVSCLGLPTLAHDVGGLRGQVLNGVNGILVSSVMSADIEAVTKSLSSISARQVREVYEKSFSSESLINALKSAEI